MYEVATKWPNMTPVNYGERTDDGSNEQWAIIIRCVTLTSVFMPKTDSSSLHTHARANPIAIMYAIFCNKLSDRVCRVD